MPRFQKLPKEKKPHQPRRKPVVVLAIFMDGHYNLKTPWLGKYFSSEGAAIEATASDPDFCRENHVVALTVSPRIIVTPVTPPKPKMRFDTTERAAVMEPKAQTGDAE